MSGSEDGVIKVWDVRNHENYQNINQSHEVGVTFTEKIDSNTLLTGSYDNYMRTFDLRNFTKPILEYKV